MYRERRKTLPTVPSSITDAIQKVKIACIDLCGIVLFLCAVLGYAFCAVMESADRNVITALFCYSVVEYTNKKILGRTVLKNAQ
jgi:hypothetical protein